jgi:hypothetical protein
VGNVEKAVKDHFYSSKQSLGSGSIRCFVNSEFDKLGLRVGEKQLLKADQNIGKNPCFKCSRILILQNSNTLSQILHKPSIW